MKIHSLFCLFCFCILSLSFEGCSCHNGKIGVKSEVTRVQSLYDTLAAIDIEDQRYRSQIVALLDSNFTDSSHYNDLRKKMHKADSNNLLIITKILDNQGWPDQKKIGFEGSRTIWAVLQHAPLKTQEKYLATVTKAVADGKLEAKYLGYFTDRISTDNGEKQKYGTQLIPLPGGKTIVAPLVDPYKVDEWRKEIGLDSLKNHLMGRDGINWTIEKYFKELPEADSILVIKRRWAPVLKK